MHDLHEYDLYVAKCAYGSEKTLKKRINFNAI